MIEFIFELIFEVVVELVLVLFGEVLFKAFGFMLEFLALPFTPKSPVLRVVGQGLAGAVIGGLSLLIVPHLLIHNGFLRIANLALAPLATGLLMLGVSRWRGRDDDLPSFASGFAFAFSMALVRLNWAG